MTVQKYTSICSNDQYSHIAGGNGPGGAAKGRIPNIFFFLMGFVGRASSRERPCLSAFRAKTTARRAVFSSGLISMSKGKPWLLVFMALGENLKISIFDPPLLEGPLNSDEELYLVAETTSHLH